MYTIVSNVTEDIVVSHLAQSELTPVTMCEQILHCVEACAHQTISLPEVSSFATLRAAAMLDACAEGTTD